VTQAIFTVLLAIASSASTQTQQTTMEKIPKEMLLRIFSTSCELGLDDRPEIETRPPIFPARRLLKPSVQSASQVCASWRRLVISTPTFWFVRLLFYGDTASLGWSLTDLEASGGDCDIDFEMSVQPEEPALPQTADQVQEWLEMNLFSQKRRIRRLRATIHQTEGSHLTFLMRQLGEGDWSRLRALYIQQGTDIYDWMAIDWTRRGFEPRSIPTTISAPGLRHLFLRGVEWVGDGSKDLPFRGISSLKLVSSLNISPLPIKILRRCIAQSSHCLQFLLVNFSLLDADERCNIQLPQLTGLSLTVMFYDQAIQWLRVSTPHNSRNLLS
jgi:hypothetical protein